MGASGVKLFDDDIALDVRDDYVELLKRGMSPDEVRVFLIQEYQITNDSPDDCVFWLALAYQDWTYGVSNSEPIQKALHIIETGAELVRWDAAPGLFSKRQKTLADLALQLLSVNNKVKPIPAHKKSTLDCPWVAGDVFAYRLPSRKFILLRIVIVLSDWREVSPVCELLDWIGEGIPEPDFIRKLPIRRNRRYVSESMFHFPMLKKHISRCQTLNLKLPPEQRYDFDSDIRFDWKVISEHLKELFDLDAS